MTISVQFLWTLLSIAGLLLSIWSVYDGIKYRYFNPINPFIWLLTAYIIYQATL